MTGVVEVLMWSTGLSAVTVTITKFLTNQKEIKKIKNEMNFFKEKMDHAKKSGDTAKTEQYMNDMLKASNKQLKQTIKPLFVSMFIFIIALQFLGSAYADLVVILPVWLPFLGTEVNWFWWYFITVLPMSMLLRKLFDIQ